MKKGSALLLVGVVIIAVALGVFIFSMGNAVKMVKNVEVSPNTTKNITYNLPEDNYVLVIDSSKKVNYRLLNSTGEVVSGENVTKVTKNLNNLKGNYTLQIENPNDERADVKIILKSQSSLVTLGGYILASGLICLTGIILLIVGGVLAWKERRKKDVH